MTRAPCRASSARSASRRIRTAIAYRGAGRRLRRRRQSSASGDRELHDGDQAAPTRAKKRSDLAARHASGTGSRSLPRDIQRSTPFRAVAIRTRAWTCISSTPTKPPPRCASRFGISGRWPLAAKSPWCTSDGAGYSRPARSRASSTRTSTADDVDRRSRRRVEGAPPGRAARPTRRTRTERHAEPTVHTPGHARPDSAGSVSRGRSCTSRPVRHARGLRAVPQRRSRSADPLRARARTAGRGQCAPASDPLPRRGRVAVVARAARGGAWLPRGASRSTGCHHEAVAVSWARLDDRYSRHPKIAAAGPLAAWLNTAAILYACEFRTKGFIPAAAVASLVDWSSLPFVVNVDELVGVLLRVRLLERAPGGYVVHDFLEYQPDRDQADARQQRREAGRARAMTAARGVRGRFLSSDLTSGATSDAPAESVPLVPAGDQRLAPAAGAQVSRKFRRSPAGDQRGHQRRVTSGPPAPYPYPYPYPRRSCLRTRRLAATRSGLPTW